MPLFFGNHLLGGTNASDNQEKIFLLGARSQEEDIETYSQNQVYAQGGILYSEGKRVATEDSLSDEKVKNELITSGIAYLTGTTSPTSNIGGQVYSTDMYLNAEDGSITAKAFKGAFDGESSSAKTLTTTLPLDKGGTNATTAEAARTNLGVYSKTEVDEKVAGLINSAPEKLDTLDELAAALGDDSDFANTVLTKIGDKQEKLTGTEGQIVGFDVNGKATAQDTQKFIFWDGTGEEPAVIEGAILIKYEA